MVLAVGALTPAVAQLRWGGGFTVAGVSGSRPLPGAAESPYHLATGGELLLGGHLGVRGELITLEGPTVVLSAAAVARLRDWERAVMQPFLLGGYANVGSTTDGAHGWIVGAGADYLLTDRFGLRGEAVAFEARPAGVGAWPWTVRVGVSFR